MMSTATLVLVLAAIHCVAGDLSPADVEAHIAAAMRGRSPAAVTMEANGAALVTFPGYTSSSLSANFTNKKSKFPWCPTTRATFTLWPPAAQDVAGNNVSCWLENVQVLVVNGTYVNAPNSHVWTSSPGNGNFDWRFGGRRAASDSFYTANQLTVEEYYNKTGLKVMISGHSMGSIESYAFLSKMSQSWKDKYVCGYFPVWPVWGGAPAAIYQAVSGYRDVAISNPVSRLLAANIPSIAWLFPRPGTGPYFWNSSEVLVRTPKRNYTASQLPQLMADQGFSSFLPYEVNDVLDSFQPPNVDTWAFYGTALPTVNYLIYNVNFTTNQSVYPGNPSNVGTEPWDEGDGLVPLRSGRRAEVWAAAMNASGFLLQNLAFPGMSHGGSQYQETYTQIVAALNCSTSYTPPWRKRTVLSTL